MITIAALAARPRDLDVEQIQARHIGVFAPAHEAGVVLLRRLPSVGVDRFIAKSPSFGSFSAITAESVPFFGNGHETLGVETRILAMRRIRDVTVFSMTRERTESKISHPRFMRSRERKATDGEQKGTRGAGKMGSTTCTFKGTHFFWPR